MMRIAYDAQADALSVVWVEEQSETSREVAPGVVVSFDRTGRPLSLLLLQAGTRFGPTALGQIQLDLRHLPFVAP